MRQKSVMSRGAGVGFVVLVLWGCAAADDGDVGLDGPAAQSPDGGSSTTTTPAKSDASTTRRDAAPPPPPEDATTTPEPEEAGEEFPDAGTFPEEPDTGTTPGTGGDCPASDFTYYIKWITAISSGTAKECAAGCDATECCYATLNCVPL